MLRYELAQELKDAGFPQPIDDYEGYFVVDERNDEEDIYQPTLSELISACGEEFHSIVSTGNGFKAFSSVKDSISSTEIVSTPEEALFYLWTALNKQHCLTKQGA